MKLASIWGATCQISGTAKHPAGISLTVRNMSILVVPPILIRRAPVGKALIHKMRSCSALKGIAKAVGFLDFVLILRMIFTQRFPRKTLHRTKKQKIRVGSSIRYLFPEHLNWLSQTKLWIEYYFLCYKLLYLSNNCFSISESKPQFYLGEKRKQCDLLSWALSISCFSYPVLQRWFIRWYGFDL